MAEVGEDAAGPAADRVGDVARATGQGIEPDEREPHRDHAHRARARRG